MEYDKDVLYKINLSNGTLYTAHIIRIDDECLYIHTIKDEEITLNKNFVVALHPVREVRYNE